MSVRQQSNALSDRNERRCWLHEWRFPGPALLDPAICAKCHCEGVQWYDLLSGGVDRLRGRQPKTDLRLVYR